MNLSERKQTYRNRVESQETYRDYIIDIVGVWGPLLAPAVPAALTMVSIAMHYPELLHIHWLAAIAIGLIVAVVIEVLGVVSVETFLDMKSYNQTIAEGEEIAPAGWAGAIMGLYIGIVISLVVLLKMVPALALLSLVPLTLLAGVTSWIVVMRKQHRERTYRKELAEDEERRKTDLQVIIADLRAEVERNNAALRVELEGRKLAEDAAAKLRLETEELRRQMADMHRTSATFGPHNADHAREQKATHTEDRQAQRRAILSGLLEQFPLGISTTQAIEALKTSGITRGVSDKVVRAELKDLGAESKGGVWCLPSHEVIEIHTNGVAA